MYSLAHFKLRFTPKWMMILLSILGLVLFTKLGLWQLERAKEKERMQLQFQQLQQKKPLPLNNEAKPKQYQKVSASGVFLNEYQFLLDNQHVDHQFGYHVMTPLMLANGQVVFVDRGWVKGSPNRKRLPLIEEVKGRLTLEGHAYYPTKNGFHLGAVVDNGEKWPKVVERIDLDLFSIILHKPVLGFIIRLDKEQALGFQRQWQVVSMPPVRHRAYALQWFAMAAIVLILFITLNVEYVREK